MHFRFKFKQQGPAPACTALNPLSRDIYLVVTRKIENIYISNITYFIKTYFMSNISYIILIISSQTLNINQRSDWEALVSSEVWYYYIINYLQPSSDQEPLLLRCWQSELPVNLVTRQILLREEKYISDSNTFDCGRV